jgi:hypothetical protein
MSEKVKFDNVNAGNDVVGRDKITNYVSYASKKRSLSKLFKKLEIAKKQNIRVKEIIDGLKHYTTSVSDEPVIGLEEKLKLGERINFIDYAIQAKEFYSKKLYRNEFYESEQEINVYLLALVESYFQDLIHPLIKEGINDIELGKAINEKIIEPLLHELEDDTLGFTAKDIQGMLYFLTGKCHIRWK